MIADIVIGAVIGAGAMSATAVYAVAGWRRAIRQRAGVETDLRDTVAAFNAEMRSHKATRDERDAVQANLAEALRQIVANRPFTEKGRALVARRHAQDVARKAARAKRNAA